MQRLELHQEGRRVRHGEHIWSIHGYSDEQYMLIRTTVPYVKNVQQQKFETIFVDNDEIDWEAE